MTDWRGAGTQTGATTYGVQAHLTGGQHVTIASGMTIEDARKELRATQHRIESMLASPRPGAFIEGEGDVLVSVAHIAFLGIA